MTDLTLHLKVTDFYTRYAESICDGDIETWPEFFTEKCLVLRRHKFDWNEITCILNCLF